MKYLLDANTCIDLMIGSSAALRARVATCDAGDLAISTVVLAEIAIGSMSGKRPAMAVLDAFIAEIELLPFDEAAARAYGQLPFKRGRFDRLIGAQALAAGLVVISRNVADFADIPGLRVENWTLA